MTTAALPAFQQVPFASRPLSGKQRPAEFLARSRQRLETRLGEECAALGEPIAGLGQVLATAIGTKGRGGGRWRPLLTLAAFNACAPARGDAMDAAVAVELTHTASLVLDDLPCMDDAEQRRGQPATHRMVGSAGAILLSIGLLARASELLGRQPGCGGSLCASWGRSFGLAGMSGGQAMDVAASEQLQGEARRLYRRKSTALPAFALEAGATVAGADRDVCEGLAAFGRGLGWSYQLLDDVEDLEEDARLERMGAARPSIQRSTRLLRQSLDRLERVPDLDPNGREVLRALAAHIVPSPVTDSGCGRRSVERRA